MNKTPDFPKILPWLAHRAGLDEVEAKKLWRQAQGRAARMHNRSAEEYWQRCEQFFLEAAEAEKAMMCAPFIHSQQRIGRLPLDVFEAWMQASAKTWTQALQAAW